MVPEGLSIREFEVPGPQEAPPVPVRVYAPAHRDQARRALPAVLYFHGGGFVTGDLETGHDECMWTASALGCVVVNVNYRLSPQHPYPHAVMDAHAALYWASTQAELLGIDDRRETVSAHTYVDTPVRNRMQTAYSWFHYTGSDAGGPDVSAYAAPARAADLRGLPPTHLSVCEFDPARDEGIAYVQRLLQSGVGCELHHYPGTFHGCTAIPGTGVTQRMREDRVRALGRALFAPSAPAPDRAPVPAHHTPPPLDGRTPLTGVPDHHTAPPSPTRAAGRRAC